MSAPCDSTIAAGETTLPFDLDIFAPSLVIMPWVKRRANGSWTSRWPRSDERLAEEARVHQVQDRVLDAADVLVDGHPRADDRGVPRGVVVGGVAVAQEVPGRVDEGVHRVGLAPGGAAAGRAGGVDPVLGGGERRAGPWACSRSTSGSTTGSSSSGTGTMPARRAVDDRDRAAPVALARDQPVAQAVVDRVRGPCPRGRASRRSPRARRGWAGRRTAGAELTSAPSPM